QPVVILENVSSWDVSRNGTLIYTSGTSNADNSDLVRIDRKGVETPVASFNQQFSSLRVSPYGSLVRLGSVGNIITRIWVYELDRRVLTRVTTEPGADERAVWAPDGKRFVYSTRRENQSPQVVYRNADGSGTEEVVWTGKEHVHSFRGTSDGRSLFLSFIMEHG